MDKVPGPGPDGTLLSRNTPTRNIWRPLKLMPEMPLPSAVMFVAPAPIPEYDAPSGPLPPGIWAAQDSPQDTVPVTPLKVNVPPPGAKLTNAGRVPSKPAPAAPTEL